MVERKKDATKAKPIESLKHKDKRANIPTEELRDFVKEDESRPETVLYPRDPSLDPQLVWKGKDEQDQQDLAVASVPILYPGEDSPPEHNRRCAQDRKKGSSGPGKSLCRF